MRLRRSSHRLSLQNAHIALSTRVERSSVCPRIWFNRSRLVQKTAYKALTSDEPFLDSSAPLAFACWLCFPTLLLARRRANSTVRRLGESSTPATSSTHASGLAEWYREPSNPRCPEQHERVATRPRRPQPWVDVRAAVDVDNPRASSSAQSARCAWSLPFDPSFIYPTVPPALSRHLER